MAWSSIGRHSSDFSFVRDWRRVGHAGPVRLASRRCPWPYDGAALDVVQDVSFSARTGDVLWVRTEVRYRELGDQLDPYGRGWRSFSRDAADVPVFGWSPRFWDGEVRFHSVGSSYRTAASDLAEVILSSAYKPEGLRQVLELHGVREALPSLLSRAFRRSERELGVLYVMES